MLYKFTLFAFCYCSVMKGYYTDDILTPDVLSSGTPVSAKFNANWLARGNFYDEDWNSRAKRGIVLIDEEFDVPAKSGVKHGWSGIESQSHDNIFDSTIENDDKDEGSGGDLVPSFETTPLHYLHHSNYQSEKTQSTAKGLHVTTGTQSGEMQTIVKTTHLEMTTKDTQPGTETTMLEGSGDGEATSTYKPAETSKATSDGYSNALPDSCLNRTCRVDDLTIQGSELVPEGSNITFHCLPSNANSESLSWYRFNGTNYNLEMFQQQLELPLTLHITRREDSGRYVCVQLLSDQTCCHREVYITVYEVPTYKYHLLTIGIVTGMCLMACILLAAFRTRSMNKYTKHFVKVKNSEKPLLI